MDLSKRLSEIKNEKGLTIDEISRLSSVPKGTASKIFAGITSDPQLSTVIALLKAMNCTLDDIDPITQNKVPAPQIEEQGLTEEELNQILIALPVVVKRQVMALVDAILGPPIQLSETSAARMAKLAAELENQPVDGGNDDLEAQVD